MNSSFVNKLIIFIASAAISIFAISIFFTVKNNGKRMALTANAVKYYDISKNFDTTWAENKFWDNGLTEVATYENTQKNGDSTISFLSTVITEAEVFNEQFHTKSDSLNRPDLYPVMKMNVFARISNDSSAINTLSSLFLLRNYPLIVNKMSSSWQDLHGNSFKELFLTDKGQLRLAYNNYFDNEGNSEKYYTESFLIEDQLALLLRMLRFKQNLSFKFPVLESLKGANMGENQVYARTKFNVRDTTIDNKKLWSVSVAYSSKKTSHYYFEQQYPNMMVMSKRYDGSTLKLLSTKRVKY